jgi:hypothetical protein
MTAFSTRSWRTTATRASQRSRSAARAFQRPGVNRRHRPPPCSADPLAHVTNGDRGGSRRSPAEVAGVLLCVHAVNFVVIGGSPQNGRSQSRPTRPPASTLSPIQPPSRGSRFGRRPSRSGSPVGTTGAGQGGRRFVNAGLLKARPRSPALLVLATKGVRRESLIDTRIRVRHRRSLRCARTALRSTQTAPQEARQLLGPTRGHSPMPQAEGSPTAQRREREAPNRRYA